MPSIITAGDASNGLVVASGNDGAVVIQSGPAGAKVNALSIASSGATTLATGLAVTGAISSTTGASLATSSGNVGVGTNAGTYQLQVKGTGQETANITDAGLKGGSLYLQANAVGSGSGGTVLFGTTFGNATPFAAIKGLVEDGAENTVGSLAFSARATTASTALTEYMRITYAGNVGIGTSSPSKKLTIDGTLPVAELRSGGYLMLRPTDNSYDMRLQAMAGNKLGIFSGGDLTNPIAVFVNGGNVGIGTSSPSKKLEVYAASDSLQIQSVVRNDQSGSGVAAIGFNVSSGAAGDTSASKAGIGLQRGLAQGAGSLCFYNSASTGTADFTTSDERMRIDSSGNLLVGTTSVSSAKLNVVYEGTYGVYIGGLPGASTSVIFFSGATNTGSISTTGTSTAFNTSSDYRLKEDWQPMTGASERVKALNPVNFAWKASGSRVDGFLAHEAQEVVPEAVRGTKDAVDKDGKPDYQGIDQSKLVPLLTAALQEALAKIDSLTARIEALEGN